MSTYYQYEDVKRKIAHRLFNMDGWKVYGYHADESDFMTDYYSPAYWGGVAEKNGYLLVVDRWECKEPVYYTRCTYGENATPADIAAKIAKLEQMTQARGASEAEEATAQAKIEALRSKQSAETVETKELIEPSHLANPPRCNWHIEKDGIIFDKGTGLLKFSSVPDISFEREREEWQKYNTTSAEEWKAEEARRESWRWNASEERAAEIAESRYNHLKELYTLLDKFNELLARFNNVCGGSVGNTESGYYTYEQVKETKYKKELKPQETESGSIKDGQCFILKANYTYGCRKGYVYRIHESEYTSAKTGETIKTYHAYRLGKGYKKERTGSATQSNTFSLYNIEKFMKWIDCGSIAWCELVEVSTPYEVTKTVKKHITPETSETTETATETNESTTAEEEPEAPQETATEGAQTAETATHEEEPKEETETATEPTTGDEDAKIYKYGMKYRGYSIGCQPGGVIDREDDETGKYYDIITYNRPLTAEELTAYELEDLNDAPQEATTDTKTATEQPESDQAEEVPTEGEATTGAATETQETARDTAPDMFAELAAAYFTSKTIKATKKPQKAEKDEPTPEPMPDYSKAVLIGTHKNISVWNAPNGLNRETLHTISEATNGKPQKSYIIAAPMCYLSEEKREKYNITFLKYDRDIDPDQINHTTAADVARLAKVETAPGFTGEPSDILTEEEAERLNKGEQVRKDTESYSRIFTAARYTDRTALLYSIDRYQYRDEPREALQPGDDFHYIGFITDNKTYINADAIREEMREDIAEAIRQMIPDEATARTNAESCEEWERRKIESAEEYGANNAADLFYKDEPPTLNPYDKGANITAADVIRYIEDPAQVVTEYATAYAQSHAADIAAAYIKYNLLTAAIKAIKDNPSDPAHLIKKIAHCIGETEKTARIELSNGETVTAEATAIRHITNGYISEWYIKAADRQKLSKDEHGRAQDIQPEEIKAIYHGQRTLYRAA